MKKYNRLCEFKLRDAELLLSVSLTLERIPVKDVAAVRAKVDEGWRLLLVNQFHDVLPGSSIELAHTEAKQWFRNSLQLANEVINQCVNYLGASAPSQSECTVINTLPWPRQTLIHEDEKPVRAVTVQPMSWDSSQVEELQPVTLGNLHYSIGSTQFHKTYNFIK